MRFWVIMLMLWVTNLSAQRTIRGTIFDADSKEPLFGVIIIVKGSLNGTMTDINGKFELELEEGQTVLKIQMLAYKSQEINVEGLNDLEVYIEEDEFESVVGVVMTSYRRRNSLDVGYDTRNAMLGAEWRHTYRLFRQKQTYDLQYFLGPIASYTEVGYGIWSPYQMANSDWLLKGNYLHLKGEKWKISQWDIGIQWNKRDIRAGVSVLLNGSGIGWQVDGYKYIGLLRTTLEAKVGHLNGQWQYSASAKYALPYWSLYITAEYQSVEDFEGALIKLGKYL